MPFSAWLLIKWYSFEYRMHMTDAYLAQQRGDLLTLADCKCRAYNAQRQIEIIRINATHGRAFR
jgi:hypothetical protein